MRTDMTAEKTTVHRVVCVLHYTLDDAALREFGPLERLSLTNSLEKCGMAGYPEVVGDPNGERVSGDMICSVCGNDYGSHPMDWRVIGYGNVPFLNVLCDGHRVKL